MRRAALCGAWLPGPAMGQLPAALRLLSHFEILSYLRRRAATHYRPWVSVASPALPFSSVPPIAAS